MEIGAFPEVGNKLGETEDGWAALNEKAT